VVVLKNSGICGAWGLRKNRPKKGGSMSEIPTHSVVKISLTTEFISNSLLSKISAIAYWLAQTRAMYFARRKKTATWAVF
jgi:hypothetical protein